MKKIVCYTCCSGGYDDILQHKVINSDWDYIFYTDNQDLIQQKQVGHWQIRPLVFNKSTNVKNARWHKVNAHILFPDYEYSLWCDANIIIKNKNIQTKVAELIKNDIKISVPLHPDRNCIYDEAKIIIDRQIDTEKIVNKEMNFLKKQHYPKNNGLNETCIIFRKHHELKEAMDDWWKMILKYSKRDQLSFNYVMWNKNIIVHPLYLDKKAHRLDENFIFLYGKNHNRGYGRGGRLL